MHQQGGMTNRTGAGGGGEACGNPSGACGPLVTGASWAPWDLSAAYVLLLMIEKLPQQLVMDH